MQVSYKSNETKNSNLDDYNYNQDLKIENWDLTSITFNMQVSYK